MRDSHPFSTFGGTTFNDVLTQLNTGFTGVASFLIDFATGRLTVTPSAQFSGFKPFILSDTTNRSGTGTSLSSLYGLGDSHRMDAARGVAVASAIAKDSSKLALADLDLAAATGTPVLTPGDGRGALALQNLIDLQATFAAAGDIQGVTTTFTEFGNAVLSGLATRAEIAVATAEDREALRVSLEEKLGEVAGVNFDEELANMIIFQNAYNAAARLITTSKEMFDVLLQLPG